MKVEIRKATFFGWTWSCPVCHYGCNIPWESAASWDSAVADVEDHIGLHALVGQRLEWTPVPLPVDA